MRRGGGKQKGAAFERKICWALSRFIDPKGKDTLFWRSAMSGGRATVQARKGIKNTTQLGDITCIDPRGRWITDNYVVECKFYKSLDIETGLLNGRGNLFKFWKHHCKLARKARKKPILIAKQNQTQTLVLMDGPGMIVYKTFRGQPKLLVQSTLMDAKIYRFKDLFETSDAST